MQRHSRSVRRHSSVRFNDTEKAQIALIADTLGVSASEAIRTAIRAAAQQALRDRVQFNREIACA